MSKKNNKDEIILDQVEPVPPGELLRRARREKGIAAEEVVLLLGVSPRVFTALEEGDYERLPSPLYVKGYIKRYCSILGISNAEILSSLEVHMKAQGVSQEEPSIRLVGQPQNKIKKYMLIVPVLLILLACLLFWVVRPSSGIELGLFDIKQSKPALLPQQKGLSLTPPLPVEPQSSEPVIERDINRGNKVVSEVESQVLHIKVLQQSWVEVQDAHGDLLVADLKPTGSAFEVEGVAPFSLVLGYAPGIELSYAGQPVMVAPIAKDNTATFKVGNVD